MKSIKTVNLKANEIQAVEMPDLHCHVRNGGTATVFASRYADVAPYTDGVLEIKSGDSKVVRNIFDYQTRQGFVYLFSESDTSVELESANDVNFFSRKIISGGESSGTVDTYNRSEINTMLSEKADSSDVENISNAVNTHVNDTSVHMTTTEKEKLENLQNYDDTQIKNNIALNLGSIGLKRKNLLKNIATSQEINGVTFTVNDDKTITANGTATAKTNFEFTATIKSGEYIFTGISEPATSSTVNMGIFNASTWKAFVALDKGSKFSVTEDTEVYVRLVVYAGYTADNVVFSPMVRYSDIIDDTYEPYQDDLQTQINDILARLTAGGL